MPLRAERLSAYFVPHGDGGVFPRSLVTLAVQTHADEAPHARSDDQRRPHRDHQIERCDDPREHGFEMLGEGPAQGGIDRGPDQERQRVAAEEAPGRDPGQRGRRAIRFPAPGTSFAMTM